MRTLLPILWFAATLTLFTVVTNPQAKPIPPGVREADRRTNAPMEPPLQPTRKVADAVKLKEEAEELAKLSAAIPGQIELVRQGQFPKDLEEHLKRVEKLAKHLRVEISQ